MPRPPKFIHPLRKLRKILGVSQSSLAEDLRVSTSTIQSIELGRLNLSENLAHRAFFMTGVDPNELMKGNVIFFITNKNYDNKSHSLWKEFDFNNTKKSMIDRCEKILSIAKDNDIDWKFFLSLSAWVIDAEKTITDFYKISLPKNK